MFFRKTKLNELQRELDELQRELSFYKNRDVQQRRGTAPILTKIYAKQISTENEPNFLL
ncbi:hypothetical protein P4J09_29595 [Bacillus cereus]|nr:hypothetical protein [Bacillus cereus]